MKKLNTSLLSFLCATALVCGAHSVSATTLSSPAISNSGSVASDAMSPQDAARVLTVSTAASSDAEFASATENLNSIASNDGSTLTSSMDEAPSTPLAPEPSSLALLGTSVLCVAGLGRRLAL